LLGIGFALFISLPIALWFGILRFHLSSRLTGFDYATAFIADYFIAISIIVIIVNGLNLIAQWNKNSRWYIPFLVLNVSGTDIK
jgi:hypothetical protein